MSSSMPQLYDSNVVDARGSTVNAVLRDQINLNYFQSDILGV